MKVSFAMCMRYHVVAAASIATGGGNLLGGRRHPKKSGVCTALGAKDGE
jgi:hypothetical protein